MAAVRPRRVVECGLEVPRGVVYQGWEPGGEYTKTLIVKNVQLRTQRIKYTIKGDQFHSAVYPRPIVLSAGMSYTLPIVFKPRKKEPCEESIELETAEGAVEISLRAVLPSVVVSLPESLKFGLCAVQDSLRAEFQISNTSNISTQFFWECPKCFTISPESGELPPKSQLNLCATFSPDSALVYTGVATFSYGRERRVGEKMCTVQLKGIGKYPHVVVRGCTSDSGRHKTRGEGGEGERGGGEEEGGRGGKEGRVILSGGSGGRQEVVVRFGAVAVGTRCQRWIDLVNVSAVTAIVSVLPSSHSQLTPGHFSCPHSPSTLPPHSSHRLPLTFTPSLPSPHSLFALFEVRVQGGLSTTTVKCIGATKVPRVVIEEEVVDFGSMSVGQSGTRVLCVRNDSDVTALFQLQLESGSVFRAEMTCTTLPPHSVHNIPIQFTPQKPIPHCKRVACLVQHLEPLFVYFIGTVYSETVRPVVLTPKHVKDYFANAQTGITKLSPERVAQLQREGGLTISESPGPVQPHYTTATDDECRSNPSGDAPTLPFANYLHSQHDPSGVAHVSVDTQDLQFGFVSPRSVSDPKSVHVTNHTEGTVVCVWMTESGGTFSVSPQEKEIEPGATSLFTALFSPKHAGKFYFQELECYVFHKGLQSYESVSGGGEGAVVTLPWCLSVRAHGHSFTPNTHTFMPNLRFETRNIVFPASGPLEPVYRSMTVRNDGDTPVLFTLTPDPQQVFTIKPLSGLIPKGHHQTLVMEMMPREPKTYKHITHCALNATSNYTQELLLSGTAELSPVQLENEGRLFFKPTCVGTTSSTSLKITNTAHLPLRYEWRISGEGSKVIDVEPRQGTILPSESQSHQWQFSPVEASSVALRAILHTTTTTSTSNTTTGPAGGSSSLQSQLRPRRRHKVSLDLFGQGLLGDIQCSPSSLKFGTVTMGTSHTHTLTLVNPSLSTLYYSLYIGGHTSMIPNDHQQDSEDNSSFSHGVKLDPCEGVLHARSSQVVRVTVRPAQTQPYSPAIYCRLISTNPAVVAAEGRKICTLDITGAYPSLEITDIHGLEVANGMSKTKLWHMLSIDKVNSHLQEDPSPSELRYAIATRHSMRRKVPVHTHAVEEFSFGAAPLGYGASVVHLVLVNSGEVEARWGFQFPTDMHLEPEYWADSGSLDDIERHHHDVITNQLFTVAPKTGTLAPGEATSLLCSFKHTHIGSSKLPVLLKIHRGREILLNWSGVTVERGVPHLFFTSQHHVFHPTPIGLSSYPTQTYELYNAGEATVTYEVDTGPLEALSSSNYLVPVLQCTAPQGEVPPRGSASLPFVFSPLEAKTYSVDVSITFSTGESVLVTFSGQGVDPLSLPSSPHLPSPQSQPLPPPSLPTQLPGQTAGLSTEHLSLGPLPLFSPVRRLVFLSNHHQTHTLSFSWILTSAQPAAEVVSVDPSEGYVPPAKSCACLITFYSQSSPALHGLDIICKVVDETEMTGYQEKLEEWTRRQEDKKHHFTLSHPPTHNTAAHETIPRQKALEPTPRSSSNSDLRGSRYQVLPPIGAHPQDMSYKEWKKQDLSTRSKARPRPTKPSNDQPPVPPTPLHLHLGLTAHTYSLSDFSSLYGDLQRFHIAPPPPHPGSLSPSTATGSLKMKTAERDLILSILCQMARELLDDGDFHTALEGVAREPVPTFTQFATTQQHQSGTTTDNTAHTATAELTTAAATLTVQPHEGLHTAAAETTAPELTTAKVQPHEGAHLATAEQTRMEHQKGPELGTAEPEHRERGQEFGERRGGGGGYSTITDIGENRSKDTSTQRSPEVEAVIESILETALLDVMREAEAGLIDITAPHFLVAHTPP